MTRDELLRKWVEALESGKYQQRTGALRHEDKYCCLGVLCDVSGDGQWSPPAEYEIIRKDRFVMGEGPRELNGLPPKLHDLAGVTEDQETALVRLNDTQRASFREIAQRIREWFPDVFTESVV